LLWLIAFERVARAEDRATGVGSGSPSSVSLQRDPYGAAPGKDAPASVQHVDTRRVEPPALDLSATTWLPLSVGPELSLELPGRLLAQVHVGWMPELYSGTVTAALGSAGLYDGEVGSLVDRALESVRTWRLAAGWRPFPGSGLELMLGYSHLSIEGSTTTGQIAALVNRDVAERLSAVLDEVRLGLSSSIHTFTVGAGWRWLIAEQVVVRARVEYMHAIAASSTLQIEGFPDLSRLAAPTVQGVLDEQYLRYVKIPVIGLGVGYHFF
jgi:hypothetical protein